MICLGFVISNVDLSRVGYGTNVMVDFENRINKYQHPKVFFFTCREGNRLIFWINSLLWEYSYDEEYLDEFNKGKNLKYFLLLSALPRNRLDPKEKFISK